MICFTFLNTLVWIISLLVSPVVLQFEGSGQWPNNFEAIQNIKAAFYIKLASLLQTKCSLVAKSSSHFVDVLKVRLFQSHFYFCFDNFRQTFQITPSIRNFEALASVTKNPMMIVCTVQTGLLSG